MLPLAVAGCLRPLYGEAASGGTVQGKLAGIVVDEVPDRIGHYLVEELRFDLDGSGASEKPRYRLSVAVSESIGSAIVSSVTGRAVGATITANATYTLTEIGTDKTVLTGRTIASASYDRSEQRFAAVSAAKRRRDPHRQEPVGPDPHADRRAFRHAGLTLHGLAKGPRSRSLAAPPGPRLHRHPRLRTQYRARARARPRARPGRGRRSR